MPVATDQGTTAENKNPAVIEVRQLCTRFGSHVVHADLDLHVRQGEIYAIVGGSGTGKSTLLREMIMLHRPDSGSIQILNTDIQTLSKAEAHVLRQRWGVMFQHGGLFGTLNVRDNVGLPLREHTDLADTLIDELAAWKITLSGLAPEAGLQYPTELSGGMLKRASMARALALDPELLFLDEPTAGLDPAGAAGIDTLVRSLHELYQSTIVIITHDLDFLWQVSDRVAVLGEGKVVGVGSMAELAEMDHPVIRGYFDGPRGRAAQAQAQTQAGDQRHTRGKPWTQK